MKAIVIGLGSMGRRRIRLLKQYDSDLSIIGIDVNKERQEQVSSQYGISVKSSIAEACKENIQCAFVCTSPQSHAGIIRECLSDNLNVFTELNLVDDLYTENIALAKERGKVLFLSSTFLYRKEVQYIKHLTENSRSILTYMYHAGQYLPDWHPWESYKNFFVGQKTTSGCREFMAIEFPWLTDVFGDIVSCDVSKDQISSLDLNYPDRYILTLKHASGTAGSMIIDLVSRKASRNFELFGEDLYLHWDGSPDGLYVYDIEKKADQNVALYDGAENRKEYNSTIIENAYFEEIVDFFNTINKGTTPKYSFEKDQKIINVINGIA